MIRRTMGQDINDPCLEIDRHEIIYPLDANERLFEGRSILSAKEMPAPTTSRPDSKPPIFRRQYRGENAQQHTSVQT